MFDKKLLGILPAILLTLTAACGSVGPMGDDTVGDDTTGDDGDDTTGDDGMPEADAAPPPPEPDAPPPPECTSDDQCPAEEPICDAETCRVCELDSECPSGACNYDTGACLAESEVLYVAQNGTGPCTRDAPCGTLQDAIPRVVGAKRHVLVAPGVYTGRVTIYSDHAPVTVHGYGAQLSYSGPAGGAGAMPTATIEDATLAMGVRLYGLTIAAQTTNAGATPNVAVSSNFGQLVLEDVELVGTGFGSGGGYSNWGAIYGTRVTIRAAGIGLDSWLGHVVLDGCRILDSGQEGLVIAGSSSIDMKNCVIARAGKAGLVVDGAPMAGGIQRLAFNTFVDNGTTVTNGTTDIQCIGASDAMVTNNIVKSLRPYTWVGAPGGTGTGIRPVSGQCANDMRFNLIDQPGYGDQPFTNIAGPADLAVTAPGLAVDAHLLPSSLAIDAADPDAELTTDADGLPRPAGAAPDIGAYEYQP